MIHYSRMIKILSTVVLTGLWTYLSMGSLYAQCTGTNPNWKIEGRIEDKTYFSKSNNRNVKIKVYTPPGYESNKDRLPVVYNMHGAGGGSPDRQWSRTGETIDCIMKNKLVRPMIYVYVDGVGTWFEDSDNGKGETTFIKELIPFIDSNYRTIASKQGRAVDGFSMGGAGCLYNAFKNPSMFSAVVSYGAALVRDFSKPNSPAYWLDRNADEIRKSVRIRMVCGGEDGLKKGNDALKKKLDGLKIPVDYEIVPGVGHETEQLYRAVGVKSLKFIEAAFNGTKPDPNTSPTPTPSPEPDGYLLTLGKGWNLVSPPIKPTNESLDVLFPADKVSAVYAFSTSKNEYDSYIPGGSSNTLTKFEVGRGYWVFAPKNTTVRITGSEVTTNVDLNVGWNLVGYPRTKSVSVADGTKSINGKFTAIYMFEVEGQEYLGYFPQGGSKFNEFIPGMGYWVHVNAPITWVIPKD
jgi:enterochelin esterase-like enzyme